MTGRHGGEHRDFRSRAEHRRDICKPGCKPESTLLQGEFERRAHLPLLVAIERTRRLAGDGEPECAVPDKASHVLYRVCRLEGGDITVKVMPLDINHVRPEIGQVVLV